MKKVTIAEIQYVTHHICLQAFYAGILVRNGESLTTPGYGLRHDSVATTDKYFVEFTISGQANFAGVSINF